MYTYKTICVYIYNRPSLTRGGPRLVPSPSNSVNFEVPQTSNTPVSYLTWYLEPRPL